MCVIIGWRFALRARRKQQQRSQWSNRLLVDSIHSREVSKLKNQSRVDGEPQKPNVVRRERFWRRGEDRAARS
jgi:hypothetical protein